MQNIFGAGVLIGTPLTNYAGAAIANPSPIQFGVVQEISLDISFDTKSLYGNLQFPIAVGRGKGKISGKCKAAQVNGALFNSILFGQTVNNGIISDVYDTTGIAIPTTPYTITASTSAPSATTIQIPSSGTWTADLGVKNANGVPLTRVASAPATGQYTVAAGVYVFAAADVGTTVFISYQYTATSTVATNGQISNPLLGYAPSFKADIYVPFNGKNLVWTLQNCVASKLSMATKLDDFTIPEFDFDAFANANGQVLTWALSE
jgi:hypothetical protein